MITKTLLYSPTLSCVLSGPAPVHGSHQLHLARDFVLSCPPCFMCFCCGGSGGLFGCLPQAPAPVVGQPVAHFSQISGVSISHSRLHGKFLERKLWLLPVSVLIWGTGPSTLSNQEGENKRHWAVGCMLPSRSCLCGTWIKPMAHFVQGRLEKGRAQPVWCYLPSQRPCP